MCRRIRAVFNALQDSTGTAGAGTGLWQWKGLVFSGLLFREMCSAASFLSLDGDAKLVSRMSFPPLDDQVKYV